MFDFLGFRVYKRHEIPGGLSNIDILEALRRKEISVNPWWDGGAPLQPCSIDLRLGMSYVRVGETEAFLAYEYELQPGECINGSTLERIRISPAIKGRVVGKSSVARLAQGIEEAGLVDPGWDGVLTLELKNPHNKPFKLKYGMPIAQIEFTRLITPASPAYGDAKLGSHYQGAYTAQASRLDAKWRN